MLYFFVLFTTQNSGKFGMKRSLHRAKQRRLLLRLRSELINRPPTPIYRNTVFDLFNVQSMLFRVGKGT